IYDKYYRQVDPTGSGRVAAADAALFLKRSGLADLVLGKIWDLADSERKGALNKQQFFIALRLVACAQNGLEVALKSLNVAVPPPKFVSLLLCAINPHCAFQYSRSEKMKFDSIFDSLGPVGGMLSGDKVKPVLLNSKLPVDILGCWVIISHYFVALSQAMYLVYRALEGEPVPMSLPPPLVPPSKRKKPSVPPVMPLLPSPPSVKDSRSSHAGSKTITGSTSPVMWLSLSLSVQWVVSPAEKAKFDELFNKTDGDMDGLVSGPEVRDIFLKTGLPSATLARIWELCDIGDIGKLTREQFALALYLINLKLTKGLDPPQNLSPEMIPPSDRQNIKQVSQSWLGLGGLVLPLVVKYTCLLCCNPREKSSVEEEIKEKEEAIRQRSTEVQVRSLCEILPRETEVLQQLQAQRQKVQDALDELDQQKASLEEQLTHIRQQTNQETQLISSLQSEHEEQEQRICQYEEELVQAREELLALQEESRKLQEKVQAAQEQLTPLQEAPLCDRLHHQSRRANRSLQSRQKQPPPPRHLSLALAPCHHRAALPPCLTWISSIQTLLPTVRHHPFGGDPFKGSDPFAADTFFTQTSSTPFSSEDPFSASADPFGTTSGVPEPDLFAAKKSSINRTESSDSFHRRGNFMPQTSGDFSSSSSSSSLPAKDPLADPFAPSSPPRRNAREADGFASFDKVSNSLSPSPSPPPECQ
uniref:Epidermal growth factor receptor pathway substrate 15 n=1 Tax=Neolamprologus brichardi TaxID=32507 RepID=A0A3Q4H4K7_NEOBR